MHTFEQRQVILGYRAAFHDMPVGDAMSGAAYGEYLKKKGLKMILGIVGAIAAVATGGMALAAYGAFGATAAAGATAIMGSVSLAGAISAGAMVAGGVMSGVGIVTGNEKLMKIGGVLTMAGGIGFAASSLLGNAGSLAGTTGATGVSDAASTAGATGIGADTASATTKMLSTGSEAFGMTPVPTNAISESVINGLNTPTGAIADLSKGVLNNAGDIIATSTAPEVTAAATSTAPAPAAPTVTTPPDKGVLGGFFENNKELIKAGGSLVKEVGGSLAKSQTAGGATAESGADAYRQAQADQIKQQMTNGSSSVLVLDPVNDKDYQRKKADAIARGIPVIDMTPNAPNGPAQMGNINYAQNLNQWNPGLAAPTTNAPA